MQYFHHKIRKENPIYLLDVFNQRVKDIEDSFSIITNDDCRPADYQLLKDMGFIFIKVIGYRRETGYRTLPNDNLPIEWQYGIPYDYILNNFSDLIEYRKDLLKLMNIIMKENPMTQYKESKASAMTMKISKDSRSCKI